MLAEIIAKTNVQIFGNIFENIFSNKSAMVYGNIFITRIMKAKERPVTNLSSLLFLTSILTWRTNNISKFHFLSHMVCLELKVLLSLHTSILTWRANNMSVIDHTWIAWIACIQIQQLIEHGSPFLVRNFLFLSLLTSPHLPSAPHNTHPPPPPLPKN